MTRLPRWGARAGLARQRVPNMDSVKIVGLREPRQPCYIELMTTKTLKDVTQHARQEMVDIASAISAFEAGEPSKFYRIERAKFVRGEIDADELHERVVEYWSRQAP